MQSGYSEFPNKRVGRNEHVGRKNLQNLTKILVGINVFGGKCVKFNKYVGFY